MCPMPAHDAKPASAGTNNKNRSRRTDSHRKSKSPYSVLLDARKSLKYRSADTDANNAARNQISVEFFSVFSHTMSSLEPELLQQLLQPHIIYIIVLELAKRDTQDVVNLALVSKSFFNAIFDNRLLLRHLTSAAFACAMTLGFSASRRRKKIARFHANPRQLALVALRTVAELRENARTRRRAAEEGQHFRFKLWGALTAICASGGVVSSCKHMLARVTVQIEGRTSTFRFKCTSCNLAVDVAGAAMQEFGLWVHHHLLPIDRRRRRRWVTTTKVGTRRRRFGVSIEPALPAVDVVFSMPDRDAAVTLRGSTLFLDLETDQIVQLKAVYGRGRDDDNDNDNDSDSEDWFVHQH